MLVCGGSYAGVCFFVGVNACLLCWCLCLVCLVCWLLFVMLQWVFWHICTLAYAHTLCIYVIYI